MKVIGIRRDDVNCNWCKPLINDRGDCVIMIKGEILLGVIEGNEYRYPEHYQRLFDNYIDEPGHWRGVGCSFCPFNDRCDCVWEEVEEAENNAKTELFKRAIAASNLLGHVYNKYPHDIARIDKALAKYQHLARLIVERGLIEEYIEYFENLEEDRL